MVMLLQMGVRVVHQHHHDISLTACSDCQHQKVHSGHFVSWDGSQDDCVICQGLATPFLQADDVRCHVFAIEHQQQLFSYVVDISDRDCFIVNPRGPPCFFTI